MREETEKLKILPLPGLPGLVFFRFATHKDTFTESRFGADRRDSIDYYSITPAKSSEGIDASDLSESEWKRYHLEVLVEFINSSHRRPPS